MPDVSNSAYRALFIMDSLKRRGHDVIDAQPDWIRHHYEFSLLKKCDLVHVYRRFEPSLLRAVEVLRESGVAVTWDNDDDLRLTPRGTSLHRHLKSIDGVGELRAMARMRRRADVVTTTTSVLADLFRQDYDGPIEIAENFLAAVQYREPRAHDGVVIGWAARLEHTADERALGISEMLREVMQRDARVRVESVGVRLDLPRERYRWIEKTSLGDLANIFSGWDIGIAPIAASPMNEGRSNIKVKEYAAAGLPWLASARGPYPGAWSNKCGGLLVDDGVWTETILEVIGSRFRLKRMKKAARAWSASQAMDRNVDRWEEIFALAIQRAEQRRAVARPR